MKGISVRSSSFRGHPIKKDLLSLESVGKFVVATSNVYFVSTAKALKVPLHKIVGITAHSDAVTILRDAATCRGPKAPRLKAIRADVHRAECAAGLGSERADRLDRDCRRSWAGWKAPGGT
jgi:hypothetical protein